MTPEESREILKLATAVGGMNARLDGIEEARKLAHELHEKMAGDIAHIMASLTEMPCVMDAKIAACRQEREDATAPTVKVVTQLKDFGIVTGKLAVGAGVVTGAIFGVGRLFGWL